MKSTRQMKINLKNPFLLYSPVLLLNLAIVIRLRQYALGGDGPRYLGFAQRLLHGHYSPAGTIDLWNGPGYPIVLMPLVLVGAPPLAVTLLNAIFQYLSSILLFLSLKKVVPLRLAAAGGFIWGFYFVAYDQMAHVATETLTGLLVTLVLYGLVLTFPGNRRRAKYYCGLSLGFLILVKVMFAYVILVLAIIYLGIALVRKFLPPYRKILAILGIAFLTTLPYLIYTYQLTGKLFYWSNSGGMSLYWMSTPFPHEYGDWEPNDLTSLLHPPAHQNPFRENIDTQLNDEAIRGLIANHDSDYQAIYQFTGVERDEAFKKKAIANIKRYPGKFLLNCVSNAGRLLFNTPYTWKYEEPGMLVRVVFNSVLFTFILLATCITIYQWGRVEGWLRFGLCFLAIYLFASIAVSAYSRMFYVIVPMFIFWILYVLHRMMRISFPKS